MVMKNGKKLEDLILQRFDQLEDKVDQIRTQALPKIREEYAGLKAEVKAEAKATSKFHGTVWGGITLIVSLVGLAIAYYK